MTAGIAEMLVQSHRRAADGRAPVVELLPALPVRLAGGPRDAACARAARSRWTSSGRAGG